MGTRLPRRREWHRAAAYVYGRDRRERNEQLQLVTAEIERRGLVLAETVSDARRDRPNLAAAPELLDKPRPLADVLITARLDCLGAEAFDELIRVAQTSNHAYRKAWGLLVLDLGLDLSRPDGELIAMLVLSMRLHEREVAEQAQKRAS